jgi:hypothetical protein
MQKFVVCGYGILLAAALTGCGKASADSVVKELLAAENDNVDLAAQGRQGKIDWDKMNRIGQRLVDLNAQLAAMPKDEVDAAKEKYKDEFLKLAERKKNLNFGIQKMKPAGPN